MSYDLVYSRAYRGIDLQDISEISLLSREIGESYDFDFLKHGFDLVLFLAFYYSNQMSWYVPLNLKFEQHH